MTFFEKLLAMFAVTSAETGAGVASVWITYQPKQPENMKK